MVADKRGASPPKHLEAPVFKGIPKHEGLYLVSGDPETGRFESFERMTATDWRDAEACARLHMPELVTGIRLWRASLKEISEAKLGATTGELLRFLGPEATS